MQDDIYGFHQSKPQPKFIDLAEMSMSGHLQPAVPEQICLKFAPPTITIVYHFEENLNEKWLHNIPLERSMLQKESVEDICNHLYMAEGYYFNPKILRRNQVKRLVTKLKTHVHLGTYNDGDKSPERHSIHS